MKLLKNQAVAWIITIAMIVAAIGIGYARSSTLTPEPQPNAPGASDSYVWDDAGVLSSRTERALDERNERMLREYDVVIGVAACNYGGNDLYGYAWDLAEEMGLRDYDMIVVLDIRGDNYCLLGHPELLSDEDCTNLAWNYMERDFARGDYDDAVLSLTRALEDWCGQMF